MSAPTWNFRIAVLTLAAVLTGSVACQQPEHEPETPETEVVARFGGIHITVEDVDARLLSLPAAERPLPGQDLDDWFREQIRELSVERLLLEEAAESNLASEPSVARARRDVRRRLTVQLCLAGTLAARKPISEEELRAAYEERREDFVLVERRSTFHLFRRIGGTTSAEAARVELEALRDRVLRGENFQQLAKEFSDSESRHQSGSIGWIRRGDLPPEVEETVFSLQEGVPSEPIVTPEGVHLFYVEAILPARRLPLSDVRPTLRRHLEQERFEEALSEMESRIPVPSDSYLATREELARAVEAAKPDAVVLRLAGTELTLADLERELRRRRSTRQFLQGPAPGTSLEENWQVLGFLHRLVLLENHCRARELVSLQQLETRMREWERNEILHRQRQQRLLDLARRDESRMKLFYQSNLGRFSTPVAWKLRRLIFPLTPDAAELMARLERAASTPDGKLEDLEHLGGKLENLGWRTAGELRALQPNLPALLSPLSPGRLTPPYNTGRTLEMLEVLERREAEPRPFEEVELQVARAYVAQYTHQLYRELVQELLEGKDLEIFPEGLAALREKGLPEDNVSPEQIESLLQEFSP